jgi:predicted aldo/keto reductase-like oxidoreductase
MNKNSKYAKGVIRMADSFSGANKLGFGYMRVPHVDGVFDNDAVNAMVDRFIELGFTYFDSANAYLGSEIALGKSLVARHPRDRYWLSSKMNILPMTKPEQMQEMFDTSLSRLGTDYLDAYFIHVLDPNTIKHADELDAWGFLRGLKERGLIKHIGTSYHGPADQLDGS